MRFSARRPVRMFAAGQFRGRRNHGQFCFIRWGGRSNRLAGQIWLEFGRCTATGVRAPRQMGTVKVEIREFREKLASHLPQAEQPLAITRHGDTVGC